VVVAFLFINFINLLFFIIYSLKMRGFKNNQGTFFHCSEIGERNWVLRLVGSGDIGPAVNVAARNVSKNPSQRLDTGNIPTPWWFTSECEQQLLSIGEDGKIPSSIKPESSSSDPTIAELTEEQLRTRLKTQLEYYFSRENLNQDRYLRSQMDNDQYVPINVVASFPKISHLTSDHDLILSVLKESINVQVDETNTKVRASHRRCTLLLREIPEFTDEREVKAMFIGCPPYTSLKYGLNNSWYVTFETEEATQLAFLHLQNLRKSFNGKQICVRIKTGSAPFPDPSNEHGRNSPAKSEIFVGIGNGISTVATSKGYITGFPASASFILNPNNTRQTTETELNLDQLMGPFGYSIRAIFQPKESHPPKDETENNVPSEDKNKSKTPKELMNVRIGPPSTEIVESMLSAAAEANETKRREKEVQKQQWQQIMDNLAPIPSIMGGQRITDMPFIKRAPPILHRFVSQESSDIEIALDIQRAARKQEKETKQQQEQQQQQKIQQEKYQTHQQQQQYQPQQSHHTYHDGYRQSSSNRTYSDRSNNKDYSQYNGYSSGERSTYDKNSDRRSNQSSYRGDSRKSFDSRSDRSSGKSGGGEYYKPREKTPNDRSYNNTTTNNYYHENNRSTNYNNNPRYEKPRYHSERKPPPSSQSQKNYQTTVIPQIQTTSYSTPDTTPLVEQQPPKERERAVSNPEPLTEHQSSSLLPVVIVSSNSTTTIVHSDAASTTSSSRRKDNSESSEYNFVNEDFPSLVEKQKIQVKEKAKFSAIVAGKKNDVKKSYAQTLKKPENKQSSNAEVT
jgi:la-related protein 4